LDEETILPMGAVGGLHEVRYAGMGFTYIHCRVFEKVRETLPLCNTMFTDERYPFFLPQIIDYQDGKWYLPEDYSFCDRARQSGFRVMADTRIRLWHVGDYGYGWEDAGLPPLERYPSFGYQSVGAQK